MIGRKEIEDLEKGKKAILEGREGVIIIPAKVVLEKKRE